MKSKIKAFILFFCLSSLIVTLAYNISPNFQKRAYQAYNDVNNIIFNRNFGDSFGQRVSLWIIGANVFKDNFLFGTGIGNERDGFSYYAKKYDFPIFKVKEYEKQGTVDYHNAFIQYSVQMGFAGLVLFSGILFTLLMQNFKSKIYRNMNILFMSVFILHSIVFYSFHLLNPMVLFALFAPILAKISYLDNQNEVKNINS